MGLNTSRETAMPTRILALRPVSNAVTTVASDRSPPDAGSGNGAGHGEAVGDGAAVGPPSAQDATNTSSTATADENQVTSTTGQNQRSATTTNKKKRKRKVQNDIQLFAFNADITLAAAVASTEETNPTPSGSGPNGSRRSKRNIKAVRRYSDSDNHLLSSTTVKTGHGFPCPRCAAACCYSARECQGCGLGCYYEAGVGVVVLKGNDLQSSSGGGRKKRKTGKDGRAAEVARKGEADGNVETQRPMPTDETTNDEPSPDLETNGDGPGREEDISERGPGQIVNAREQQNDDDKENQIPGDDTANKESFAEEWKDKFNATSRSNAELKDQVSSLQSKHDGMAGLLKAKEAELEELEQKADSASADLSKVQADASKLHARLETTCAERDAADDRAKKLESKNETALDMMVAEKDQLSLQLQEATTKLETANMQAKSAIAEKDNALANMETKHNAELARLYADIETYKQQLNKATKQITTLSSEKTTLVTRIASAIQDPVAEILRGKDTALEEAQETIASLKASSASLQSPTNAASLSKGHAARKVSLEGMNRPPIFGALKESKPSPSAYDAAHSLRSLRFKSTPTKRQGRVRFDNNTSFGEPSTNRVKFSIFSGEVNEKENLGRSGKRKSRKKSATIESSNKNTSSSKSACQQQPSGTSSCEESHSNLVVGRRRKKPTSGGGGGKGRNGKSSGTNGRSDPSNSFLGGFEDDGDFLSGYN